MKNFIIVIMFVLFAGTVVYSAPSAAPIGKNADLPITQLAVGQTKDATLTVNSFLVGNWKYSPADLVMFTTSGKLGIKMPVTDISKLPTLTDTLTVGSGGVRLAEISTAGVAVCADSNGTIIKCQTATFSHSGDDTKPYETYTYKVPDGVTKITVELYGAGGAGYFDGANSYDRSPDNYSGCGKTSGGNYNCSSGGSAFFYDTNGSTQILQAKGGQVATGKHTGGKGGAAVTNSHTKIVSSAKTEENGGDGGSGDSGKSSDTSQTFKCSQSGPNYTATIGGEGGVGGYGGRSSSAGGLTPGGFGGRGGFSLLDLSGDRKCEQVYSAYLGKGSLSIGGSDGQFGSGGSGAGGIGGYSDRGGDLDNDNDSLCVNNSKCTTSEQGYAGGGGGGYTKAQLEVKGGETYVLKLSHGGEVQGFTENKGTVWCYYQTKWTCNGGSYSGNGSGAYAKVTVN